MADVTQQTFDVSYEGASFTFRIPKITHDVEVGYKAADVRRRAFPEGRGYIDGLDYSAVQFSRYAAYLELYLTAATAEWPFSAGADGKPVVDSTKFPFEFQEDVYGLGAAFETELSRFRRPRAANNGSASAEAVAGVGNPGSP